jgi:hypothetical protein
MAVATGKSALTLSAVTSGIVNEGYSDLLRVRRMRSNGRRVAPIGGSSWAEAAAYGAM